MGSHPINLGLRLLLELCALGAVGLFGWVRFSGALQWALTLALPLAFMGLWGTFAVADDPSRSGSAPVAIPGIARLFLELALFGLVSWALHISGFTRLALIFAVVVVLHYGLSWDRIAWLWGR